MDVLRAQLSATLDKEVQEIVFFTKGQVGDIYKVETDSDSYILKTSLSSEVLKTEARMLYDINKYNISVPKVYDVSDTHLLLEYIEEGQQEKSTQEREAAKLLSTLHSVTNDSRMYGYYYNTTIGPFNQINEQTQYNWALFLGQMRIMPMARECYDKAKISGQMLKRLEGLCRALYKRIDMSLITPSLLHGDLWGGNILFNINGATVIDPALYFGDREMELSFIKLFDTFGETFFEAYEEVHPLSDDFYETKVPLYQIYPLLVHVALYAGSYVTQLEQVLKRLKV